MPLESETHSIRDLPVRTKFTFRWGSNTEYKAVKTGKDYFRVLGDAESWWSIPVSLRIEGDMILVSENKCYTKEDCL